MTHSIYRRATALLLSLALCVPMVYANAGDKKLTTQQELADGLTYINTISDGVGGRIESFSLALDPNSDIFPISVQASGKVYGAATMSDAIKEAENMGYHVLGGINSDYFSTSSGVPLGIVIQNGEYLSSPGIFPAVTFENGKPVLVETPKVTTIIENTSEQENVTVNNFNKLRNALGGIYLFNEHFSAVSTRTTTAGWVVRMEVIKGEMTVDGSLTLRVTECLRTDEAVEIGENEYILTADDAAKLDHVYDMFSVGDRITIENSSELPALEDADWATGVGDIMIEDGTMTDSDEWEHTKGGRAPRTAMGVKEDGTMLLYVADGRQSGYSAGLGQVNLAKELLEQGCEWAVNLDGGGSSNISALLPGKDSAGVINVPSEGRSRPSATFILFVSEDKGSTRESTLALTDNGLTVLAGSSVTLGDVVAMNDLGVTLDREVGGVSFTSQNNLGTFNGTTYTAGASAGTDTIEIYSDEHDITGTAQIHVVTSLTDFIISAPGSEDALKTLVVDQGDELQLSARGSYWSRAALRQPESVTWTFTSTSGGVVDSSVDANGLFTAGTIGGTLSATAGGLSTSIPIVIRGIHTDVLADHWAYDAVRYCYDNGFVSGISTTEFGVGANIRRGDFMLMLYNALGQPPVTEPKTFTDVAPTDYYATAISWAAEQGITAGIGNGAFGAADPISREQAFTMLNKALPLMGINVEPADLAVLYNFSDEASIAPYARAATATMMGYRFASGFDGRINPKNDLTREEMAALIYHLKTYDAEENTPLTPPPVATTGLSLSRNDILLFRDETFPLIATATPKDATDDIVWSSSNPTIASVSPSGVVTNLFDGIGLPTVTITATAGEMTASCVVRCRSTEYDPNDPDITPPTPTPDPDPIPTPDPDPVPTPDPDPSLPDGLEIPGVVSNTGSGGLNLRAGTTTSSEVLAKLPDDTAVTILKTVGNWYEVRTTIDGKVLTGFVSAGYITVSTLGKVVDADVLNIRSGYTTDHDIVGKLALGDFVVVLETLSDWYHISATIDGETVTGYVFGTYLSIVTPE